MICVKDLSISLGMVIISLMSLFKSNRNITIISMAPDNMFIIAHIFIIAIKILSSLMWVTFRLRVPSIRDIFINLSISQVRGVVRKRERYQFSNIWSAFVFLYGFFLLLIYKRYIKSDGLAGSLYFFFFLIILCCRFCIDRLLCYWW